MAKLMDLIVRHTIDGIHNFAYADLVESTYQGKARIVRVSVENDTGGGLAPPSLQVQTTAAVADQGVLTGARIAPDVAKSFELDGSQHFAVGGADTIISVAQYTGDGGSGSPVAEMIVTVEL